MQFSDTSSAKDGVLQECESLVFADQYGRITDDSELLATFTRFSNQALDRAVGLILESDQRWQYDDTNYTEYPIGTTDLVDGQKDYTFETELLKVLAVEVKDNDGQWYVMQDWDYRERGGIAITEFLDEKGLPQYYDTAFDAVWLHPAPSSTDTDTTENNNGLKVYYQRGAEHFTTSDTTKEPGLPTIFHWYVPLWASYKYAVKSRMEVATSLRDEITLLERSMQTFYNKRNKDSQLMMQTIDKRRPYNKAR